MFYSTTSLISNTSRARPIWGSSTTLSGNSLRLSTTHNVLPLTVCIFMGFLLRFTRIFQRWKTAHMGISTTIRIRSSARKNSNKPSETSAGGTKIGRNFLKRFGEDKFRFMQYFGTTETTMAGRIAEWEYKMDRLLEEEKRRCEKLRLFTIFEC